jgi:outer membrane lipoprotein SlyB
MDAAAVHIWKRIAAIVTGAAALNGGIDRSRWTSEEMNMSNITPANASGFGEAPIRSASTHSFSRPAALIGGATALIALTAIATTLVVSRPAATEASAVAAAAAVSAQALSPQTQTTTVPADKTDKASQPMAQDDGDDKPMAKPVPAAKPSAQSSKPAARPERMAEPAAERSAAAPVCDTCGVVEAVTPYQQKGEGSGIGAVAGGVLGGVLGNQVGGGNGKKAMTVIGAVGGGMAGHEIEKRQRATTMYSVKVRMQDGTLRTLTQATAPTVGQKVTVEGSQVKARA